MLSVIGAVGQAEREAMLERQREGIARAKREGRYKGRVPTARRQAAEVARLKAEGLRPSEIAIKLGIGRASVYRVLGKQEIDDRDGGLMPANPAVAQPVAITSVAASTNRNHVEHVHSRNRTVPACSPGRMAQAIVG